MYCRRMNHQPHHLLAGLYFGAAFSYFLNGFVLHLLGWRAIFYITGCITLIWCMLWYFVIYDTPQEHPHITNDELSLIQKSIGTNVSEKRVGIFFEGNEQRCWFLGLINLYFFSYQFHGLKFPHQFRLLWIHFVILVRCGPLLRLWCIYPHILPGFMGFPTIRWVTMYTIIFLH